MRLKFPVEIVVDVPDAAFERALAEVDGDINSLAIGAFGDLRLAPGDEPEGALGEVVGYETGDWVERADNAPAQAAGEGATHARPCMSA